MRHLATIQKIATINNIPDADKIQVATLENLGWECVVKKDEFKVGDIVVYTEIDSILPEKPEYEFLRESKFRLKIRRFKKQISQGLILPISSLPKDYKIIIGDDVTATLGFVKYDPQAQEEKDIIPSKHRSKTMQMLMSIPAFRKIYLALNSTDKGNWPQWGLSKTDESRIASDPSILLNHFNKSWYICEKIDGQSSTFFLHKIRKWGINMWSFGVCSRNIHLKKFDKSNYWAIAKKNDIENKLRKYNKEVIIQGEIIGKGIQGNKYKITESDLFIFNYIENNKRFSIKEMIFMCDNLGLKYVPIINQNFIPSQHIKKVDVINVVRYMTNLSKGISQLYNTQREGIVCRLIDNPNISFKVINPNFLLAEKD